MESFMRPVLDWSWCRSFLEVLRTGSFSGAARRMGVAHPTVRRHVTDLESALGARLFVRSPAGLVPTEAALAMRPAAEAMEAAAEHLARTATGSGQAVAGTVRITASEIMGAEVLPSILAALRREHPGLAFELRLTDEIEDILRHDADIAVRMVRPAQADLVARKAGTVELGLYATTDWIAAHGTPHSVPDLVRSGGLAGYDRSDVLIAALRQGGTPVSRADFGFRSDSTLAQLAAVRAGLAAGIVQAPLARRNPSLVRVLPAVSHRLEVWLTTHRDLRGLPRIEAVFRALGKALGAYAADG
jgi:DNA-binding transcriptional LysR family regulator